MKSDTRSLSLRCAAVIFAVSTHAAPAVAQTAARGSGISCVVPNLWKQEPKIDAGGLSIDQSIYGAEIEQEPASAYARQTVTVAGSWSVTYKGTGYDRLRGPARDRIARHGVLWTVNPADLGVSAQQAITALLQSGAVVARRQPDGSVYFRAREAVAQQVAMNAASRLTGRQAQTSAVAIPAVARTGFAATSGRRPGTANLSFSSGLQAEVAMLRLEGRMSGSPAAFIDQLPSGNVTILPFGTSYVVHIPPSDFESVRDYIADQGSNILLVGATGRVEQGRTIGYAIRACGGNALADRFPTPSVVAKGNNMAVIDVEGQNLTVSGGDTVLVVQPPIWGTGLEVALMRFVR